LLSCLWKQLSNILESWALLKILEIQNSHAKQKIKIKYLKFSNTNISKNTMNFSSRRVISLTEKQNFLFIITQDQFDCIFSSFISSLLKCLIYFSVKLFSFFNLFIFSFKINFLSNNKRKQPMNLSMFDLFLLVLFTRKDFNFIIQRIYFYGTEYQT
jgi:hypothetical protein